MASIRGNAAGNLPVGLQLPNLLLAAHRQTAWGTGETHRLGDVAEANLQLAAPAANRNKATGLIGAHND